MLLGFTLLTLGLWMLVVGWREVYQVSKESRLATSGLYGVVRHPQYTGILLVVFGELIHWPTIPTLVLSPGIVLLYVNVARSEERRLVDRFDESYLATENACRSFFRTVTTGATSTTLCVASRANHRTELELRLDATTRAEVQVRRPVAPSSSPNEPLKMNSKIFPSLYDLFLAPAERGRLGLWRHAIVSPASGRVLEIGAGTGLNFAHYRPGARVVAIDPDFGMLERAKPRVGKAAAEILLVAGDAEALPFRDNAFDEAVVGLAMCTIPDPTRALRELRRTLAAGVRLRLLEHVRLDSPVIGRLQDWLTPMWRQIAAGCHLNRRTAAPVERSGFTVESVTSHLGGYLQEIVACAHRP